MIIKTRNFKAELNKKQTMIIKDMIEKSVLLPVEFNEEYVLVDIDTFLLLEYFLKF